METITNAASTAATTVSNLVFGAPNTKDNETTTNNNETAGQEPISGEQGKGTAADPFDKGNSEDPANPASKSDDYLKLNPTVGKSTATTSTANTSTGTTGETAIPILPLNPDASALGSGKTNTSSATETGITDKAGVTDKTYKETPLDDIKLSGAPGAGPSAPAFTPAAGDTNATSTTADNKGPTKYDVDVTKDTTRDTTGIAPKDTTTTGTHHDSSASKQTQSVDSEIDAIINKGTSSKAEHTVKETEAENPHSKMNDKTVRQTDAAKTGDDSETKGLAAENAGRKSESNASNGGEEKSGKKMSALKDKLKDKLHIGSKDK